jgi:hypothetical protein
MADHEPMMDGGCAEPELSQQLRDALTLLRQHSDDEEFCTRPARQRSATSSSPASRKSSIV